MRYQIDSTGNGAFWTIKRLSDGATLFLQGDDAVLFDKLLECTTDAYCDDALCDEYASLFA